MKIKMWKVLPIPLTAGVGLELGRLPPREKFGFESCWRYIFISWKLFWKIIMIALSQRSNDEVSVLSEWVNDFTFWVFLLLSGRTFLTKTGKFLGGRTKTDKSFFGSIVEMQEEIISWIRSQAVFVISGNFLTWACPSWGRAALRGLLGLTPGFRFRGSWFLNIVREKEILILSITIGKIDRSSRRGFVGNWR